MILNSLHIIQFKNYENSRAEFSPGFNFITGMNGMGKTNLLDSIYYVGMTKSYFHNRDKLNVRKGSDFFRIVGHFSEGEGQSTVVVKVQPGSTKTFELNGQKYEHLTDHVGKFPMLMSTPSDAALIMDTSRVRRRYFDALISQMDAQYLKHLMIYRRFLRHRNACLKKKPVDFALIEVYTEKMALSAGYIHQTRKTITEQIAPYYQDFYHKFGGHEEQSEIRYSSQLQNADFLTDSRKTLRDDSITGRTSIGIHKDDYKLLLNGHNARYFASQGQMKSILFALHLSKYAMLHKATGKKPIMLLDDIFDKLDDRRLTLLIETLQSPSFGQVFLTDTSEERLRQVVRDLHITGVKFLHIKNGQITILAGEQ